MRTDFGYSPLSSEVLKGVVGQHNGVVSLGEA